ncbi:MAG: hypothetical protein AB8G23_01560 [Myxococcota bacterium]
MMLTTSLHPDDLKQASDRGIVRSFLSKPLTTEAIEGITQEAFPEIFRTN